jgi:hypothetical protein
MTFCQYKWIIFSQKFDGILNVNRSTTFYGAVFLLATFSGATVHGMNEAMIRANSLEIVAIQSTLNRIESDQGTIALYMGMMRDATNGRLVLPTPSWGDRARSLVPYAVPVIMPTIIGLGINAGVQGFNLVRDRIDPEGAQRRKEDAQRKIEFRRLNNRLTLLQSQIDKCDKDKEPERAKKLNNAIDAIKPRWIELDDIIHGVSAQKAPAAA